MKLKAKTRNLIKFLCILLGAVFAFSMGTTFAKNVYSNKVGSNPVALTNYFGNQDCVVVNDSLTAPITFGVGTKLTDVSIQYSVCYDFDLRVKYSLYWSGGASSSNVILNYPDRDNFIVDNNYIFVRDTISAGSGKLAIISSVSFVDPEDSNYLGQTLTINIDEIKLYKKQTNYTSSHPLVVESSLASTAWLKHKSGSVEAENAYILVYNYRYTEAQGVEYPNAATAYKKETNSEGAIISARPTLGNKYYAGMGVYIVTGSSSVTIKALAVGMWSKQSHILTNREDSSGNRPIFENNIGYNYSNGFKHLKYETNHIFENVYYEYVIPANSGVYINIVDSVEITSLAYTESVNFDGYRMITNLTINDTLFSVPNQTAVDPSRVFNNGIAAGTISSLGTTINIEETSSSVTLTEQYSQPNVVVSNTSTFNSYLYDVGLTAGRSLPTNVVLTNNTGDVQTVSVQTNLSYDVSNGNTIVVNDAGGRATSFGDTTLYYKKSGRSTGFNNSVTLTIAPYSSVQLLNYYNIPSSFNNELKADAEMLGKFDVWVSLTNQISSASTEENNSLPVEVKISNNVASLYVKNNTANQISGINIPSLRVYKRNMEYSAITNKPTDWEFNYWKYYVLSNGEYVRNTSKNFVGTYYMLAVNYQSTVGVVGETLFNGFTKNDDGNYSSATLTMQPNERKKILSFNVSLDGEMLVIDYSASYSTQTDFVGVDIVNEGFVDAYVLNNTTDNYYINLTGATLGTNANKRFTSYESEKYFYVEVLRSNQIINCSMQETDGAIVLQTKIAGKYFEAIDGGVVTFNEQTDGLLKAYLKIKD